jgi:L-alanine-DL-glutamate epimerase-like enolase superfamily enzyme
MKITDVKATILKPNKRKFVWREGWDPRLIEHILLTIKTDDGLEGHCITWLMTQGEIESALPGLKAYLVGKDPHHVEEISYKLTDKLEKPGAAASTVDICLWDLLGKHHRQPIYRLLGAARDKIRAYASTYSYDTVDEYVQLAFECRDQGFNAFKLHAFGVPHKDIEVCRAVRKAVGATMDLMLDPVNAYDRKGAFKVGAVLEELDFYWYEAPIPDSDLQGLTDLTRSFRIPITAVESVAEGLRGYPKYLTGHVVDGLRSVGDWIGGISAMRKSAALCEAFNVNYEPHSYGTTLVQAAHLHVMLAIHNCDLFEIPVPQGVLDDGMMDIIRVGKDGNVQAPTKPGLGYDLDPAKICELTVKVI